jgi:hypothetical protein
MTLARSRADMPMQMPMHHPAFELRRDIDAVAIDILAFDDDVPDVNPEPDRTLFRATGVMLPDLSHDFDRAGNGIHYAREFHQRPVADELHDAARMGSDRRINKLAPTPPMSHKGQSLQIDDIRAMSASPPTAVELTRRRER